MKKALKVFILSSIVLLFYACKDHGKIAGSYSREYKEYYSADTSADYLMMKDTMILVPHGNDFEIYNHSWHLYSGKLADGYIHNPGIVPFLGIFNEADTSISTPQGVPYKFSPKMDAIYMADEKDKIYLKVPD